jgi:hypothetical protein
MSMIAVAPLIVVADLAKTRATVEERILEIVGRGRYGCSDA